MDDKFFVIFILLNQNKCYANMRMWC